MSCSVWNCTPYKDLYKDLLGSMLRVGFNIFCICIFQICSKNHVGYEWCSQPRFRHAIHVGDLRLAASIVVSGNNNAKISLLFKALGLGMISSNLFYKVQQNYCIPAIGAMWHDIEEKSLEDLKDRRVIIAGTIYINIMSILIK